MSRGAHRPVALALRALGLGDFFTGLPALHQLRRALPDHRLVLALPRGLHELALMTGCVDDVVHGHELEPLVEPPLRPDLAIDLHGNGPESVALLAAIGPRRIVAFAAPGGPVWRADEHEVDRWCRLVREGLPAPDAPAPPVGHLLPVPREVPVVTGATVLHVGGKSASRRWPCERFAAVAILLRAAGHDVVVTGGDDVRDTALAVAAAADVRAAVDLSLPQLLALVARARLVISGDTGVAHVASNYRTPSVVLFGPVSPAVWGPPAHPRHQVLWHGDGTGDPHGAELDPALDRITVAEVVEAAARAGRPAACTRGAA